MLYLASLLPFNITTARLTERLHALSSSFQHYSFICITERLEALLSNSVCQSQQLLTLQPQA